MIYEGMNCYWSWGVDTESKEGSDLGISCDATA
jgi:hypothetical protein